MKKTTNQNTALRTDSRARPVEEQKKSVKEIICFSPACADPSTVKKYDNDGNEIP